MILSRVTIPLVVCVAAVNCRAEDARTVLSNALAQYAHPATYYAEGTEEDTLTDDTQRSWQQEVFVIAKAAENRYHYDIKASDQWNIAVGDGTVEWVFQPWRNEYTRRVIPTNPISAVVTPDDTLRHFLARAAQSDMEDLAQFRVGKAEFLTDEKLTFGSQQVLCYVIRATSEPGDHDPAQQKNPAEFTFWIEKDRRFIRKEKIVDRNSDSMLQPLREVEHTHTASYARIELGGIPPTELFSFTPPATAKQTPRLFLNLQHIDLTGLPAPALPVRTLDGKEFDPKSVSGHSVIVDFWASWCVPCIQEMQSLSQLYGEGQASDPIVIGVNLYEAPTDGIEFLKKHHYDWINLRGTAQTATAWMLNGIPLLAIIDANGNLAYYHSGYEKPEEAVMVETLRKLDPKLRVLRIPCSGTAESD